MTTHQHTPGPWALAGGCDFIVSTVATQERFNIFCGNPAIVCQFFEENCGGVCLDFENKEANARLIAAAPELLEALEAMLNGYGGELPKLDAIAFAAIKKAKGE
jgi:hypothetical protein